MAALRRWSLSRKIGADHQGVNRRGSAQRPGLIPGSACRLRSAALRGLLQPGIALLQLSDCAAGVSPRPEQASASPEWFVGDPGHERVVSKAVNTRSERKIRKCLSLPKTLLNPQSPLACRQNGVSLFRKQLEKTYEGKLVGGARRRTKRYEADWDGPTSEGLTSPEHGMSGTSRRAIAA